MGDNAVLRNDPTNAVGKRYDAYKESMGHYQTVSLISYEELWEMWNSNPNAKGLPEFFCVLGKKVHFYPAFDPKRHYLMCKGQAK